MEQAMELYMAVIQTFQFLILGYFISVFYKRKNPGRWNVVYVFAAAMVIARTVYVYLLLPVIGEVFYTPYMMLAMGAALYICYRMNVWQIFGMIAAYIGMCSIPTLLTRICITKISYIPKNILSEGDCSPETVIVLSIMDMIINLVYVAILVVFYSMKKSLSLSGKLLFFLIFLYQILIFTVYIKKCMVYDPILQVIGILMVVVTSFMDSVLITGMRTLLEEREIEEVFSRIYEQRSCELQYYQVLDEQKRKLQEVHADFSGKLMEMYDAAEKKDETKELIGLMNETSEKLGQYRVRQYSRNQTINSVIFVKKEKAKAAGIHMDVSIQLPEQVGVEAIDLCSIFCNLLDNAIEACEKVAGERYIRLTVEVHAGYLMITEVNPMYGTLYRRKGKIISSKKEPSAHGYGLGLLKVLSQKYGGKVEIREKKGMFFILVTMKPDAVDI